jgi:hypothetical protein
MSSEKVSSEQLLHLVAAVPGQLRSLAAERDEANTKVAELQARVDAYELHGRAVKVAQLMHEKSIDADVPLADLVADLEKRASELPEIERAVAMSGPSMSVFGQPGGKASSSDGFINAIMGH